jgi:hypothetical protein
VTAADEGVALVSTGTATAPVGVAVLSPVEALAAAVAAVVAAVAAPAASLAGAIAAAGALGAGTLAAGTGAAAAGTMTLVGQVLLMLVWLRADCREKRIPASASMNNFCFIIDLVVPTVTSIQRLSGLKRFRAMDGLVFIMAEI